MKYVLDLLNNRLVPIYLWVDLKVRIRKMITHYFVNVTTVVEKPTAEDITLNFHEYVTQGT